MPVAEDRPVWVDGTSPSGRGYSNYESVTPALGTGAFWERTSGEFEGDCFYMDPTDSDRWHYARE